MIRKLKGRAILFDPEREKYFGLNPSGMLIWDLFGEPAQVNSVAKAVADQYQVELSVVRQDVAELVEMLLKNELIVSHE